MKLKTIMNVIMDLLYPRNLSCVLCGEPIVQEHESNLCQICLGSIQFNYGVVCKICGRMLASSEVYHICQNCRVLDRFIDGGTSVVIYDEFIKKLMFDFKYYNKKYIGHTMAVMMVNTLIQVDLEEEFDYIVPVPLHNSKLKKRGFNQAYLIASYIGEITGLPIKDILVRTRNTPPLNDHSSEERYQILENAFKTSGEISGRVLLVDDIFTTGHTLNHCAKVLKHSGVDYCFASSFAVGE